MSRPFSPVILAIFIILIFAIPVFLFTRPRETPILPTPTAPSTKLIIDTSQPVTSTRVTPTATITVTPNLTQIANATLIPTTNASFTIRTRTTELGVEQIWVPAGSFIAGDPTGKGYDDATPHQVYTDEFWIDRFLVTNAKFALRISRSTLIVVRWSWINQKNPNRHQCPGKAVSAVVSPGFWEFFVGYSSCWV